VVFSTRPAGPAYTVLDVVCTGSTIGLTPDGLCTIDTTRSSARAPTQTVVSSACMDHDVSAGFDHAEAETAARSDVRQRASVAPLPAQIGPYHIIESRSSAASPATSTRRVASTPVILPNA
jgi:hypothetical protein